MSRVQSVLFITTSFPRYPRDFAGSFVFRFAKYLAREGLRVTVAAPGAPNFPVRDMFEKVEIHRFTYFYPEAYQCLAYDEGILGNIRKSWVARLQVPFLLLACVRAVYHLHDNNDIIHCHWLPTAVAALMVRFLKGSCVGIILTNWGSDTRLLPKCLSRWVLKHVDGVISTAIETDAHLLELGRTEFCKITAPVDEDRFKKEHVSDDLRQKLNIDHNIPVIAFIARLDPNKDPMTFIDACALLRDQGILFVGVIAGDGELRDRCFQAVSNYGLQENVLLLGMRDDPEKLMRISSISVHISSVENTWSNAITEAMFMEVPVILSDSGHTRHLFTHEENCFIVPAGDACALSYAIKYLLENEWFCERLSIGAKNLLHKYGKNSSSIVNKTINYYGFVLDRKRKQI